MPFVKLDCGILKSTIWSDSDGRIVFLTALLMATPREYEEPVPQINVRDNGESGWSAPAGWYGFVAAASTGIAKDAGLPIEAVRDALERLGATDHESRSPEYDGRRLIRVNGGYLVLNFQKYRDFDYGGAERQKRFRERQKQLGVTRDVTGKTRDVTQAEAEAEAEAEAGTGSNLSSPKEEDQGSKTSSARAPERMPDDEERKLIRDVLRIVAPKMLRIERRNLDNWRADAKAAGRDAWWICAALISANGSMKSAKSPSYVTTMLGQRHDDEWDCPNPRQSVEITLRQFGEREDSS